MQQKLTGTPSIQPANLLGLIKSKGTNYWMKVRERQMLELFHATSKRVPAYKDYLKKSKVNPERIETLKDFASIPPINKKNYLRVYPFDKLVWDGDIKKPITIHATSGSTGEPTYFQKEFIFDRRRELILENFFNCNELTLEGPTLFVITFGMGVWSAGMSIYTAAYLATNKNTYPISIISPGVNKIEVLKILKKLAPHYRQVIIAGYPPFVKDIVDDALHDKIKIKKFNTRFIFTGESFTEEFRNYLSEKAGIRNIFTDTMNTYGTSELGAMAVETPASIFIRRLAQKKNVYKELFGDGVNIPTLAQYIPYFVNFECVSGDLYFTGNNTIPLVRYQPGDSGGVFTFQQLENSLLNVDVRLKAEFEKLGISKYIHKLPFVYVYERKNLATTLYGILIYPEFLKIALLNRQLNQFLTGKFTMIRKHDKRQNQYLEINLELKKGVYFKKYYETKTLEKIIETLKLKSSEFRELYKNLQNKANPKLVFWPYEDEKYFKPGIKQTWVKKIS